jgi:hypothetical protein
MALLVLHPAAAPARVVSTGQIAPASRLDRQSIVLLCLKKAQQVPSRRLCLPETSPTFQLLLCAQRATELLDGFTQLEEGMAGERVLALYQLVLVQCFVQIGDSARIAVVRDVARAIGLPPKLSDQDLENAFVVNVNP